METKIRDFTKNGTTVICVKIDDITVISYLVRPLLTGPSVSGTRVLSTFGMFVRMLTVNCDQNNSFGITITGYQVRKMNKIRNVIYGLHYGKPPLVLRPNLGCSPS